MTRVCGKDASLTSSGQARLRASSKPASAARDQRLPPREALSLGFVWLWEDKGW